MLAKVFVNNLKFNIGLKIIKIIKANTRLATLSDIREVT